MLTLLDLPTELIIKILAGLGWRTLVRCTMISKRLQAVIQDSESLSYSVELAAAGFTDNVRSSIPLAKRFKAFRQLQASWNQMKPVKIDHYYIEQDTHGCIRLSQGHICHSRGYQNSHDLVRVVRLPSTLGGIKYQQWELPHYPFAVRALDFDPSQDLLILLQMVPANHATPTFQAVRHLLHVLSLETGLPHPKAPRYIIELPGHYTPWNRVKVESRGRYISVHVTRNRRESWFGIVDWQLDELKLDLRDEDLQAATLIDLEHSVLLRCGGGIFELQLYVIQEHGLGRQFTHLRTFEFPEGMRIGLGARLMHTSCCTRTYSPVSSEPPPGLPFFRHGSPSDILSVQMFNPRLSGSTFSGVLFFHFQAILQTIHSTGHSPARIPWSCWSSKNTSWCHRSTERTSNLQVYTNGERAVLWGFEKKSLLFWDMNVSLGRQSESFNVPDGQVHVGPDLLTSYLPRLERCWDMEMETLATDGLMMDDERLIFINTPISSVTAVGRQKKITVWNMY